jgi:hypothetical protein
MAARCTIRDGLKWCNGPCGRELPVSQFYVGGRGSPNPVCKGCHRVAARRRYRRRYRYDAAFRRAERARKVAASVFSPPNPPDRAGSVHDLGALRVGAGLQEICLGLVGAGAAADAVAVPALDAQGALAEPAALQLAVASDLPGAAAAELDSLHGSNRSARAR